MAHGTPLEREMDRVRDLGHAAVNMLSTVILVAIVAVVLAKGSATAQVIRQGFALLAWLVSLVMSPLAKGAAINLDTPTETPAGGTPQTQPGPAPGVGITPGTGTGPGLLGPVSPGQFDPFTGSDPGAALPAPGAF